MAASGGVAREECGSHFDPPAKEGEGGDLGSASLFFGVPVSVFATPPATMLTPSMFLSPDLGRSLSATPENTKGGRP